MPNEHNEPESSRENITIYEVAERAGVSIATVSHALNRPERVAETTRRRVLDTAEELGFVPRGRGKAARSLRRIAVSGPFDAHRSYVDRLLGILHTASEVDVIVVDDSPGGDEPVIGQLSARGPLDGVILMGAEPTEALAEQLREAGVPVVLLDRPSQTFTSVTVDDELGGALVAAHLTELGVERITWVSPAPVSSNYVTNGELRLRGFVRELRDRGLSGDVQWVISADTFEGGREAAREMVRDNEVPQAVFALHDLIAAGIVSGFREQGIRVPEDVRVVGYDDVEAAELFDLTTVHQPFRESGAAALEALQALRTNADRPVTHTMLMPELVARASTAPHEASTT